MRNTLPRRKAGFFVAWAEAQKSRVITPGPCADEPVYRLTFPAQEGSNTHPSTGQGAVNFGSLRFVPARPPLGPAEKFQSLDA